MLEGQTVTFQTELDTNQARYVLVKFLVSSPSLTDPFSHSRKVFLKTAKISFDGVPFMIIASKIMIASMASTGRKLQKKKSSSHKVSVVSSCHAKYNVFNL